MLMLLPSDIRETVLRNVADKRNVSSACKELRPKQTNHQHPTHREQARMIGECNMSSPSHVMPFDNPFLLQLYRIWKAPHTHNALVSWVLKQRIRIDEGGLYACVPYNCTLRNTEGVECLRMRVQLWDRVNRSNTIMLNGYGGSRRVWRLFDGVGARAYMPVVGN
jgi:hypothetical protein